MRLLWARRRGKAGVRRASTGVRDRSRGFVRPPWEELRTPVEFLLDRPEPRIRMPAFLQTPQPRRIP